MSTGSCEAPAASRPKSWHGGKPLVNRAVIDEMQNKLAARRAKVSKIWIMKHRDVVFVH